MLNFLTMLNFTPIEVGLPEEEGNYICIMLSGQICTLNFNIKHGMFNVSDDNVDTAIVPLAWAPFTKKLKDYAQRCYDERCG